MMRICLIPFVVGLVMVTKALAVEPAHQAAIKKLIEVTRQKEQYQKATMGAIENSMSAMAEQVPEEKKAAFAAATERIMKLMEERLGWEALQEQIVALYAEEISQEEIEAVLPLVESKEMQTYLEKTAKLGPRIAEVGSSKASDLQPEILKIIQEEMSKP